jgi:tetratricopeptide (TPR) repeat protein
MDVLGARRLQSESNSPECLGESLVRKAIIDTLQHNMRQSLNQGRLDEAAEILARLKKEDPISLATRGFELEFYLNSNRFSEAEALAEQLCRLFPDSARILFLAGKLAYRRKHYEEAEGHFRESHRLYPHWRTQHWLGKTLTQAGKFEEAESLLLLTQERHKSALLDLAWLYERRNDLDAALKTYDDFLAENPGNSYASDQRIRIRAKRMDAEDLMSEVGTLADLGEEIPPSLFPEFIQKLFETGQTPRAREEIAARIHKMDWRSGVRIAWICYQVQAYDLACTLFLAHLDSNKSNYKYLRALESAADKCGRLSEVAAAYQSYLPEVRHFYGRWRALTRRTQ